jgi:catechol 2,3-dioxygenase-like lactoylglutathione lyase family enzyme
MIDHVTIRVSHLAQSKSFYEKAFSPLGFKLSFGEEGVFWAFDIGSGWNGAKLRNTLLFKLAPRFS